STCAACQSSRWFLATLVSEAAESGVAVRLLSDAPAGEGELAFAGALGLDPAAVVPVNLRTLRVRRVPTIVLVDQNGEIHYAREGAMPGADQQDLLRSLTSLTR